MFYGIKLQRAFSLYRTRSLEVCLFALSQPVSSLSLSLSVSVPACSLSPAIQKDEVLAEADPRFPSLAPLLPPTSSGVCVCVCVNFVHAYASERQREKERAREGEGGREGGKEGKREGGREEGRSGWVGGEGGERETWRNANHSQEAQSIFRTSI